MATERNLKEYLDSIFGNKGEDQVQISMSREGAYVATHFLNRFIKGIATAPETVQIDKFTAFYLMQLLFPMCKWEEGEEKIIVSSLEQLQKFL